jgi:hypothetical protein
MQHFRKILRNRQKQKRLGRFLSKEKLSGGYINEPQLSTRGFHMKEG